MALGGYKFAGRFCQKGSLTDAEWRLLSHKTKVDAFMAANAASDAGWDYYMDGSPDGNYHCIDEGTPGNNNFVTCFYNSRTGTYFAIYTITKFASYTSNLIDGAVRMTVPVYRPSSTSYYLGIYASYFVSVGTAPITFDLDLKNETNFITPLVPVGNHGASTSFNYGTIFGSTDTYISSGSVGYYGFAVRDDNIIVFSGLGYSVSDLAYTVVSGHAFSSLVNPNDSAGCFVWNMQSFESSGNGWKESATTAHSYGGAGIYAEAVICQYWNGTNSSPQTPCICALPLADFDSGTINAYPYQALCVAEIYNSQTLTRGKGVIDASFLAVNFSTTIGTSITQRLNTVANGNYICLAQAPQSTSGASYRLVICRSMNGRGADLYPAFAFYGGWDPSNPTITEAAAWTEYTGD